MPDNKLFFSHSLLLLVALMCPMWQLTRSVPIAVTPSSPVTDTCVLHARNLLVNITQSVKMNLFNAINCTRQGIVHELDTHESMESACMPKSSMCSGMTFATFDQVSCLTNIGEDLRNYFNRFTALEDPEKRLPPTILSSLQLLLETCFPWSLANGFPFKMVTTHHPSTYDERLHLCKVLKGFQVRTITINRIIGYINSGENKL